MMSDRSLQTMVKICRHAVFSSYVTWVKLSTQRFLRTGLYIWADDLVDTVDTPNSEHPLLAIAEARQRLSKYSDYFIQQRTLERSGIASTLLQKAFLHLARRGRIVGLGICDKAENAVGSRQFFEGSLEECEHYRAASLALLLLAALRSGCYVDAVSIEATEPVKPLHTDEETHGGDKIGGVRLPECVPKVIYQDLTYINLEHKSAEWFSNDMIAEISLMLSCARKVFAVNINFGITYALYVNEELEDLHNHTGHFGALNAFAAALDSSDLHTLQLERIVGKEEDYIHILHKHRNSLRHLVLDQCGLWEGGCWRRLLRWIEKNLGLVQFSLLDAWIETGATSANNSRDRFMYHGQSDIPEIIKALAPELIQSSE